MKLTCISEMQEVIGWLLWVAPVECRIVWGIAEICSIEQLAGENGLSETNAKLVWMTRLVAIASRMLNREGLGQ